MYPFDAKLGSTAMPSRPIDLSVQTDRCPSAGFAPPSSRRKAPPFSVTRALPPGRNAIAVGSVSPLATVDSVKPAGTAADSDTGDSTMEAIQRNRTKDALGIAEISLTAGQYGAAMLHAVLS